MMFNQFFNEIPNIYRRSGVPVFVSSSPPHIPSVNSFLVHILHYPSALPSILLMFFLFHLALLPLAVAQSWHLVIVIHLRNFFILSPTHFFSFIYYYISFLFFLSFHAKVLACAPTSMRRPYYTQ